MQITKLLGPLTILFFLFVACDIDTEAIEDKFPDQVADTDDKECDHADHDEGDDTSTENDDGTTSDGDDDTSTENDDETTSDGDDDTSSTGDDTTASEDDSDSVEELVVSETFGPDKDDLMIQQGQKRWTVDADTGTALFVDLSQEEWSPVPITIREFLEVWYDLQDLELQEAFQYITYSCNRNAWNTYLTPHTYETRKVRYHDGLIVDFKDPNGHGASYAIQNKVGMIRKMEGGFSVNEPGGFRARWSHAQNVGTGCVGTPDECKITADPTELLVKLGGVVDGNTFNRTNCSTEDAPRDYARTPGNAIRFYINDLGGPRYRPALDGGSPWIVRE